MITLYINININFTNYNIINFKLITNLKIQLFNNITIYNNKSTQLIELINLYFI